MRDSHSDNFHTSSSGRIRKRFAFDDVSAPDDLESAGEGRLVASEPSVSSVVKLFPDPNWSFRPLLQSRPGGEQRSRSQKVSLVVS